MIRALLVYTVALIVVALAGSVYAAAEAVNDGYWGLAIAPLIPAAVVVRVCWLMWQEAQTVKKMTAPTVKKR